MVRFWLCEVRLVNDGGTLPRDHSSVFAEGVGPLATIARLDLCIRVLGSGQSMRRALG